MDIISLFIAFGVAVLILGICGLLLLLARNELAEPLDEEEYPE